MNKCGDGNNPKVTQKNPLKEKVKKDKIPILVQSGIKVVDGRAKTTPLRKSGHPVSAGFDHIIDRHFNRSLGNNRSIFSISQSKLKTILQSKKVIDSPATSVGGGQFVRTVDVGEIIGNIRLKDGGGVTSRLKVFTDKAGNIITSYPVL